MPRPAFFKSLGFYVVEDFLESSLCAEVCAEMEMSDAEKATIVLTTGERRIDETIRKVRWTQVSERKALEIRKKLEDIRPKLEEHFGVNVVPDPLLNFLTYDVGSFYSLHCDNASPKLERRRISVTIFLNDSSEEPEEGRYSGGKLALGGIEDPQWANCVFPLEAHAGLLVAFPSGLIHEVRPVTFGRRFTIVAWFLAE